MDGSSTRKILKNVLIDRFSKKEKQNREESFFYRFQNFFYTLISDSRQLFPFESVGMAFNSDKMAKRYHSLKDAKK